MAGVASRVPTMPLKEIVPRSAAAGTCRVHVLIGTTYIEDGQGVAEVYDSDGNSA